MLPNKPVFRRIIASAAVLLCIVRSVHAVRVVHTTEHLITAINDMNAGTINTIVLQPNTFEGDFPRLTRSDSVVKTFRSASSGEVPVIKNSTLYFNGAKNVRIESISFIRTATTDSEGLVEAQNGAENIDISQCTFEDDPMFLNVTRGNKYIVIVKAGYVKIHDCSFGPKNSSGEMVTIRPIGPTNGHTRSKDHHEIYNCTFHDFMSDKAPNGSSFLTIGGGDHPLAQDVGCVVRGNTFCGFEVPLESESISNKSSGNIYEDNVFYGILKSNLTIRAGNDCVMARNHFFNCTGGIVLTGKRNRVVNNYFDNIYGWSAAVTVPTGGGKGAGTPWVAANDCIVASNTFVNCRWTFKFDETNSRDTGTRMPESNVFENNLCFVNNVLGNPRSFLLFDAVDNSDSNKTAWETNVWTSNLFDSGRRQDVMFSHPNNEGEWQAISNKLNRIEEDAAMSSAGGYEIGDDFHTFGPNVDSAALEAGSTSFSKLTTDIRGKRRAAPTTIGSLEHN